MAESLLFPTQTKHTRRGRSDGPVDLARGTCESCVMVVVRAARNELKLQSRLGKWTHLMCARSKNCNLNNKTVRRWMR